MSTPSELRIEPAAAILEAARRWLEPVRNAMGHEFLAAHLTGSVLTQGFDPRHSRINLLIVARTLDTGMLERISDSMPVTRRAPHIDPLFLTRRQIEKSLDVFPIEWIEIQERNLLLEGEDVVAGLEVPRAPLRLQLEHELRGKHIQLRQTLLMAARHPATLERMLHASASSFAALFRTLIRLRGETPPAEPARVVEHLADLFQLDAAGLLVPHLVRYAGGGIKRSEIVHRYRKFLVEIDRLVHVIDELRKP